MKQFLLLLALFWGTTNLCAQTDLSDLHAPPTQAEIDAVKAYWASLDHSAVNWEVLHTGPLNGFTVDIVRHQVDGNWHYGAVRYPENYDPMGSYPVLVSNHGGASGVNVTSLNAYQSTCYRSFFVVLPSFRSEELRTSPVATIDYTSEGAPSEMDGDTDDALALLSGVLAIPGADATRVGATGGSRGGGVSHLMAAKDDRIKRVCVFYGATDHMALPGLQQEMENYVDNGGGLNPPEANTYTYGVEPYLNGDLTLAEARLTLLRRSVQYFVDELPLPYQVHHGDVDPVVTVNHSQLLATEFANQGITAPDFEYFEYAGESHNLPPATGAPAEREAFLCELNSIVMPVELMEFQGTCEEQLRQISLEWTALIDQSTNRFELQWSANSRNWTTIKTLDISASANQLANYIYNDTDFQNGENYYRLKEIDADGQVHYHRVINVTCGSNAITLSPNPTSGIVHIALDQSIAMQYPEQVFIFDVNGQKVLEKRLLEVEDEQLDLSDLPKGTYSCHFLVKGNWVIKRVVKM